MYTFTSALVTTLSPILNLTLFDTVINTLPDLGADTNRISGGTGAPVETSKLTLKSPVVSIV